MIDITHVHPMLVHFPIVLYLIAVALQVYIVATGGDLAAPECLPRTACIALVFGTVMAAAAVVFGDIALDHAADLGFPKGELEEHEELGFATLWIFVALSVLHLGARWKDIALEGGKGWVMALAGVAGVVVLIIAAAHGGELVYEMGVNVKGVVPTP
jgi:uncharacterized membrane protein